MAAQRGNIVAGGTQPTPGRANASMNNRDDSTGNFVNKDPHPYPRPQGGPEPSAQGATPTIADSAAPYSPGYDISGSLDGASIADLKRGYCKPEKIDGGSDGMQGA